jgi:hypothetical protein
LVGKFDHNSKVGREEGKDTTLHKFGCTHLGSNLYLGFFCGDEDLSIPLMFPMMHMCWGKTPYVIFFNPLEIDSSIIITYSN